MAIETGSAQPEPRGYELRDYLRMIRSYWVGAVLVLLFCLCVGGAWTIVQPRVYASTASGVVQAPGTGDANLAYAADQLSKSEAQSYVELGKSLAVARRVVKATGSTATPASLLSRVSATLPDETAIIEVTSTGPTPASAAELSNAWVAAMGKQIAALQGSAAAVGSTSTTFKTLADASVPTAPTSPNVRLALLLSGLAGLVLGFIYLLVRNTLDRRIRSSEVIEREFGTAVLGTVPMNELLLGQEQLVSRLHSGGGPRSRTATFATLEALRELRTNLSYVHVDARPKVIVVTSPQPGDGKSTIAVNLAETLALSSSERVVIIDCDLRRPQVSKIFSVAHGAGLTDVLSGRVELPDVMQQTEQANNLWVIGAGRTPPNPSELLGSQALADILDSLSEHAFVIVDAPPVLAVTDAAVLSSRADGVLVVVSAKHTTFDQLGRTIDLIGRGGGEVLGAVLNRVPMRGAAARAYGYYAGGNYSYYGDEPADDAAAGGADGASAAASTDVSATDARV